GTAPLSSPVAVSERSRPTELRLALAWELWVIEQLLSDAKLDSLVTPLVEQGVAPELARSRVLDIRRSEGFTRLARRLAEPRLAAKLQRLQAELAPERSVAIRETVDRDRLLAEHWIRSRPLLLTHAVQDMRAVREWSLAELARRFPTVQIEVNVERLAATHAADTETRARTMPLTELVAEIERAPSNDFYVVSRNGLLSHPELRSLWDELAPLPPFLVPLRPPHG